MINITDKELCCGCGGCAQICPAGCISMESDSEGFLYPAVDSTRCVNCGLCERACPIQTVDNGSFSGAQKRFDEPYAFGGWNKDESVRQASSSGGVFSLLANEIIRQGGVVFGAVMQDFIVRHACASSEAELAAMRGSKYVQSEIGDTYRQVRQALKEGRPVLFSGTPCQTAGLVTFLGEKKEKLYLVDCICHGVPSPRVFSEYLDSIESKAKADVITFSFREKDKGWSPLGQMGTRIKLSNGKEIRNYPGLKDSFMCGFSEDYFLRESCYNCRFKSVPRWGADITIADFWGVNKTLPEMFDHRGTSLVFVHSQKGMRLFEQIRPAFEYRECNWKKTIEKNPMFLYSAKKPPLRERFFQELDAFGYDKVARKHLGTVKTVVRKALRIIPCKAENILLAVLNRVTGLFHVKLNDNALNHVIQFLKFCMVGVTNVAVSYSVNVATLLLLHQIAPGFRFDYVIANIAGFLIGVYWSFLLNSSMVFHFSANSKAERRMALLKSYLCYGFTGIILNNILSTIWIRVLCISKFVSPLLNLLFTIPINYITNKKWAYAGKQKSNNRE